MYYFILGVCHCVAFSSCVSNPVLYGWLNTNLRKEFLKVCQDDDDDDDDCATPFSAVGSTIKNLRKEFFKVCEYDDGVDDEDG